MKRTITTVDATLSALADPTRRQVVQALLKQPRRAGELAAMVGLTPPALSRHLRVLRRCGVIVEQGVEHDARVRVYALSRSAFTPLRDWLEQVENLWETQLRAFKAHAERTRRSGERKT
jgi:DNA-binding transcriptional ArsR family regulator